MRAKPGDAKRRGKDFEGKRVRLRESYRNRGGDEFAAGEIVIFDRVSQSGATFYKLERVGNRRPAIRISGNWRSAFDPVEGEAK